mmetsp:Transcript_37017/g.66617  ORF Transcript_37017/g.66617 Transcript_37017/m.66617 type:complete len:96 (+) Transcript_37017:417-704(+)
MNTNAYVLRDILVHRVKMRQLKKKTSTSLITILANKVVASNVRTEASVSLKGAAIRTFTTNTVNAPHPIGENIASNQSHANSIVSMVDIAPTHQV